MTNWARKKAPPGSESQEQASVGPDRDTRMPKQLTFYKLRGQVLDFKGSEGA